MLKTEGNVSINQYGIATCTKNCTFHFHPEDSSFLDISFSFLFLQISPDSSIKFGIHGGSDFEVTFDYYQYLSKISSQRITPQIPIDGVGVLIHLYVSISGFLTIYVNDVIFQETNIYQNEDSAFFLSIVDDSANQTIVALPVNINKFGSKDDNENNFLFTKIESNDFNRFFPSIEPNFMQESRSRSCISDFSVMSYDSYFSEVISSTPLLQIPTSDVQFYFEVNLRHFFLSDDMNVDFSIGLTKHDFFVGNSWNDSYKIPENAVICYCYRRDIVCSSSEKVEAKIKANIRSNQSTVGFGISQGSLFFTYNGEILYKSKIASSEDEGEIYGENDFYPFLFSSSHAFEFDFNFGQWPFSYEDIQPPLGWRVWYPKRESHFRLGMKPHRHLLNAFLSFGKPRDVPNQLQYDTELTQDEAVYEVTMLGLEKPDLIGCGFANRDLIAAQMVGWNPKCVGLHSDDGSLFFERGCGTKDIVPDYFIKTGTVETVMLSGQSLSFFIDRDKKENVCTFPYERIPTISAKGGVEFVLNFGESPFFALEEDYKGPDSVQLFNKLKVRLSNGLLQKFGSVKIGDVIESRDRQLRATIAGSSDDRIYVYIPSFQGAFPLCENKLFDFFVNYRIAFRKESLFQRILTNRMSMKIDIKCGEFDKIFPSTSGVAFFIGKGEENGQTFFVFRPVVDLFNNSVCQTTSKMPAEIFNDKVRLFSLLDHYKTTFKTAANDLFQLFDVILFPSPEKVAYLVLGKGGDKNESIVLYNGVDIYCIDQRKLSVSKKGEDDAKEALQFVLNPFGNKRLKLSQKRNSPFRSFRDFSASSNIGMTVGGRCFPIDYTGFYASDLEVKNQDEILFPKSGHEFKVPPVLEYFLMKLMSRSKESLFKSSVIKSKQTLAEESNEKFDWIYSAESKFEKNLNLVTEQEFSGDLLFNNP